MNVQDAEILHFPSSRSGKGGVGYYCTVTKQTKGKSHYRVGFSPMVTKILKEKALTHFYLRRDNFSGLINITFLKGDDLVDGRVGNETSGQARITNAGLVNYLGDVLGYKGDFYGVKVEMSGDLSRIDDFANFRLLINQ